MAKKVFSFLIFHILAHFAGHQKPNKKQQQQKTKENKTKKKNRKKNNKQKQNQNKKKQKQRTEMCEYKKNHIIQCCGKAE